MLRRHRFDFLLLNCVVFLLLALTGASCPDDDCPTCPPLPGFAQFEAGTIEASELSLKISCTRLGEGHTFLLMRDSRRVFSTDTTPFDTVVWDRSLLPHYRYRYRAYDYLGNSAVDSTFFEVTTGDTTSHDFTWEVSRFGDGISGFFRDVAIINDTCMWAVGYIDEPDSTPDPLTLYNAAHWNGQQWELLKILSASQCCSPGFSELYAVTGFSPDDIWTFSVDGAYSHWNGKVWETQYVAGRGGSGRVLWGKSANDLYVGGTNGSIVHFDGSIWTRLETGTTLTISDIWGGVNPATGEEEIMAVAGNFSVSLDRKLLRISNLTVTEVFDRGIEQSALTGLWFIPGSRYYVAGSKVYTKRDLTDTVRNWASSQASFIVPNYKTAVRGNAYNDVFVATQNGHLLHYNGYSWVDYQVKDNLYIGYFYPRIAVKGDLVVAVGGDGDAIVSVGRQHRP